ncbi:MAG: tripartite tricarboxylate transporter TctB family protein [Rhodocyclaceae bacterium]|nr:tripartite tricarboxylate transporter TctB family protein [Rhodocyclaceae bacterium]
MAIRHPKDFFTGVMYAGVGAAALLLPRDYGFGTALRMGPAYFPGVVGGLLVLVGMIAMLRGCSARGDEITPFAWRELLRVLGGVVLFGLLLFAAGLIAAIVALVIVAALASRRFDWRWALPLALGLALFGALLFVQGLGVQMPLAGSWFGR